MSAVTEACTSNIIAVLTGTAPTVAAWKKEQWVENLTAQLFATSYYHVVFTIPDQFNALILGKSKDLFTLLFQSACATLLQFGCDPQYLGAVCGISSLLHTWGQDLSFHAHLHCTRKWRWDKR